MKKYNYLKAILLIAFIFNSCANVAYISIESEPQNAKVYVISKWNYEKNEQILMDLQKLKEYQINEGNTPVITKQKAQKYKVIISKGNSIEIREVDLKPKDTTHVKIIF